MSRFRIDTSLLTVHQGQLKLLGYCGSNGMVSRMENLLPMGQQYKTTARIFPAHFCSIHTLKVARFPRNMSVLSNLSKTKVNTFFFQLKKTIEVYYTPDSENSQAF